MEERRAAVVDEVEDYLLQMQYFSGILDKISIDSDTEVERVVGVNLTGELHYEAVVSTRSILQSGASDLSKIEVSEIEAFSRELDAVPRVAQVDTPAPEGHLVRLMDHRAWFPTRAHAKKLAILLRPTFDRLQLRLADLDP